jgi:hypothetical protein
VGIEPLDPGMGAVAVRAVLARCAELEQMASGFAPLIKRGGRSQGAVIKKLEQALPGLEPELAQQAISQALYFHWRDEGV